MATITIMTAVSAGIYASQGGGTTKSRHTWASGPLNLLRAARLLPKHARRMTDGYGNIGHAGSWVQIGDQRIDSMDLPETLSEARDLLRRVTSGQYAADQAATAASMARHQAEEDARHAAAMDAEMRDTAQRMADAETHQRKADEAAATAVAAEWQTQQQQEAADHAAWRAATDASQAARDTGRAMRRDWRRAGC